ncbi:MAG TPA: DUF2157 domain-containing protein [Alphaproteobacteria bacterium]|nr:DUF2157 domain-containing protein [Alphaproteobacteria bacterium]
MSETAPLPGDRARALEDIKTLALAHGLSLQDISSALNAPVAVKRSAEPSSSILNRLFLYLGGVFLFAGLCALAQVLWDDMGSAQRVIVSFASGLVALAMGLAALRDLRFEKAATPFFLISAVLQPTGLFVFLHEYFPEGGDPQLAALWIFGIMALQQGLVFWKTNRTSLLFFALVFLYATLALLFDRNDIPDDIGMFVMGLSLVCLGRAIDRTHHRPLTPFGYFLGTSATLFGFFDIVEDSSLEIAYLGLNAFFIYLSLHLSSRTILFVSVAGLLSYIAWYTSIHFAGVVGWPVALIVLGFVFLALGALTVRLSRRIRAA